MSKFLLTSSALFFLSLLGQVQAQEDWGDDWGDDWEQSEETPWRINGFVELGQGQFLQNNSVASDSSLSEVRARINFDYDADIVELSAKGDLSYDNVLHKDVWQTRELYLSSRLGSIDVRAGRQVLTWGTGDYIFLNDLFAKDWQSFFSGRDDEYLKAPSDSLRITTYLDKITVDLAWTPEFQPDNYINGERFSFYSPQIGENIAPAEDFNVDTNNDDQWSVRLATNVSGTEYALYGYKGRWPTPVGNQNNGTAFFPKLNALGASARSPLAGGILNAEVSYYDSREDRDGDKANIPNSQTRVLLGYEREAARNFTVGGQYYLEKMHDYAAYRRSYPSSESRADEYRHLLTLRLTLMTRQQRLNYSLFTFFSPSDEDAYFKPTITYRHSDAILVAGGANIFTGNHPHTFFGQHEDNSNVWLRFRYSY